MDILTTIAARPVSPFTDTLTKKLDKLLKGKKNIAVITPEEFGELHAQTSGAHVWAGWIAYNNRQVIFSCNDTGRCVMWKS